MTPSKKVFISHASAIQDWVDEFAAWLIDNEVKVVTAAYDLKLGQDIAHFLEKVNHNSFDHILIICEQNYVEAVDKNEGLESMLTQIVRPEVYKNPEQTKVIPIALELDEKRKPLLPQYLAGRNYLDYSNPTLYESSLAKLLVTIFEEEEQAPIVEELPTLPLQDFQKIWQKNVVNGNISNNQEVHIGDKTTHITNNNYSSASSPPVFPKDLTALMFKQPKTFIGRDKELKQLKQLLFQHKKVVVVNGMGGIGKTTLVEAYTAKHYKDYAHIACIVLNPEEDKPISNLIQAEGLLANLGLILQNTTPKQLFTAIMAKFKSILNKPCLLVLDGAAAQVNEWHQYLPNWHILITSRINLSNYEILTLDFLSLKEAIKLFRSLCTRVIFSDQFLTDLIQELEYHTLTIDILARTAHAQRLTTQQVQDALQIDLSTTVKNAHSKDKIGKITTYLCNVFATSYLGKVEKMVLQHFVALPRDFHSYTILQDLLGHIELGEETLSEILDRLSDLGWLLYSEEQYAGGAYRMHRIVAEVVKREVKISQKLLSPYITTIITLITIDDTKDNPVDKFQWIPFSKAILECLKGKYNEEIATLQNNLATTVRIVGDFEQAKTLLEATTSLYEKEFGPKHPTTATSYSNLASVLYDLGQSKQAKLLYEKAIIADEYNFGKDHPYTLNSYFNLASVLHDLGQLQQAKELLETVTANSEKIFGKKHSKTAKSYSKLGLVLHDLGNPEEAIALLKKALLSNESTFGHYHPTTAGTYHNLAFVLHDLGQIQQAKSLLKKATTAMESNFGRNHPSTAACYSNLATILLDLGQFEQAQKLLEKAIKINKIYFGKYHPSIAIGYSNIAIIFRNLQQPQQAQVLLEKALKIFENSYGREHPSTAINLSNLASVFKELGQLEKARNILEKALGILEKKLGGNHPATIKVKSNLINILKDLGYF